MPEALNYSAEEFYEILLKEKENQKKHKKTKNKIKAIVVNRAKIMKIRKVIKMAKVVIKKESKSRMKIQVMEIQKAKRLEKKMNNHHIKEMTIVYGKKHLEINNKDKRLIKNKKRMKQKSKKKLMDNRK